MEYRKLGSTGMMVSRVGFGGIPIMRGSRRAATRVLRKALDSGVNFYDTHRRYGDSELMIGEALSARREEFYLATKISDHSRRGARKSLRESLRRLRTEYIDLLFIKNLDSEDVFKSAMGRDGSLRVAREAQRAGKVRHIGLTSHTEKIAVQALRTGEFEAIMFPYSVVRTDADKRILPFCSRNNTGFVCMKPVAGGLLTVPSRLLPGRRGRGKTAAATSACRFCLSHRAVTTVIPGLSDAGQLEEALAAIGRPMTEKGRRAAAARVVQLGNGFCRNCGYCKPCPQGVDINNVFRFYHYSHSYGLEDYAREKYRRLKGKASACVQCGACLPRCPYKIDIPARLKIAHRVLTAAGSGRDSRS
jgi:predicted aldo/keto reductase-like oxidoreductase